jgi:tetratricopeptide (TPR) repeat protein
LRRGILLLAWMCVTSLSAAASAPQARTPVGVAQDVQDLANIDFSADVRVFAVMAALNAGGYEYEAQGREMSPLRKRVRQALLHADPELLGRLTGFYRAHLGSIEPSQQHAAYISLALLLSGPPDFQLMIDKKDLPDDPLRVLGFESLVSELYLRTGLEGLWRSCESEYRRELLAYRPVLVDVIKQTLGYFRIPPRIVLDSRIVLIPDLLGPGDIVNARNVGKVYHIVVGPAERPEDVRTQLQHEYLHFIVDPLMEKYAPLVAKHEHLLDLAQNQPRIKPQFQNQFGMLVTESLVETLLLRLNPPEDLDRSLVALFRQGLIFAPYFHRGLSSFQAGETLTFPAYLQTLLEGVQDSAVRKEEAAIAELEAEYSAQSAVAARAQREQEAAQEKRLKLRGLVQEGEALLRQKQFSGAREKLQEVLSEDSEHGLALFYLAQAAAQEQKHEEAFALFERTVRSQSSTPAVRAWARLRMGSYLASKGRYDEARSCFSEVQAMTGDLQGAPEEARRLLEQLP